MVNKNKPFYFRLLPDDIKQFLIKDAEKNERTLSKHIIYILKTYMNVQTTKLQ